MGCAIDHLQSNHEVRVLQDFTDARGQYHRRGETGIIRAMDLDWPKQELWMEWERDGKREAMCFSMAAKTGPRSGQMKTYFAMGERAPASVVEQAERKRRTAPEVPAVTAELVQDPERYADALARTWALAARKRFDEARGQMRAILAAPDPHGGTLEQLANDLVNLAVAHAGDADRAVYQWLRDRAIDLWYAWGSQATSGGEGAYRAEYIRAAERRLAECDARR